MNRSKAGLALGNLLLSVALLSTVGEPRAEYSLSPYSETVVWACLLAAVTCGVLVVIFGHRQWRLFGAGLSIVSMVAAIGLPMLRAPYYYGFGDPLTHLGYLRSLLAGDLDVFDLFYPVFHTFVAELVYLLGIGPRRALLLTTVVLLSTWFVGSVVLLRRLGASGEAGIAFLAPLVVLPINPVSIFPRPHPATAAVFFTPVVLYAFACRKDRRFGLPFLILFGTLLLLHPLVAIITASLLLAWPISQEGAVRLGAVVSSGWRRPPWTQGAVLLATAAFLGSLFYLLGQAAFQSASGSIVTLLGQDSAGAATASRSSSLSSVGGSLLTFGLKIGAKYLVFGILSAIAVFGILRRRDPRLAGLAAAVAPVFLAVGLFIAAGQINIWSRLLSLLMVVAMVLGAAGLRYSQDSIEAAVSPQAANLAVAIVLLGAILVAFPVLHPSPYIYSTNERVPEDFAETHDHMFEFAASDGEFLEIRKPVYRYHHGLYGTAPGRLTVDPNRASPIPDHFSRKGIPEGGGPRYVPITTADEPREVGLYNGFRYSRADFRHLPMTSEPIYDSNGGTIYIYS